MQKKSNSMPKFAAKFLEAARKEAPTIMSIGAVGGVLVAVYFTVKATPKANDILAKRKEKLEEIKGSGDADQEVASDEENDEVEAKRAPEEVKKQVREVNISTAIDLFKVTWPAITSVIVTSSLILGANHINMRRLAYLGTAYKISSEELKKYREKAKEIVGEKKERDISEAVAKDNVAFAAADDYQILGTGKGDLIFFDRWSGRFFRASDSAIKAAVNEVNRLALANDFASLDDFYYELGLPQCGFAEEFGFFAANGYLMSEPTYSHTLTPNGEHAIELTYDIYPRHKFDDRCL